VDWSSDGKFIASGDQGLSALDESRETVASVRIWDPTGRQLNSLPGYTRGVTSVRFSPDGTMLATMSEDAQLKIWRPSGTLLQVLAGEKEGQIRWSPDAKSFFLTGRQVIRRQDREGSPQVQKNGSLFCAERLRFNRATWSPAGTRIAATTVDGRLRIFMDSGRHLASVSQKDEGVTPADVVWNPDGKSLAFIARSGPVQIFNDAGRLLRTFNLEGYNERAAWNPDGRILAVGQFRRIVLARLDGTIEREFPGHRQGVESLAWSPDGSRLASGGEDGAIRIWHRDGSSGPVMESLTGDVDSLSWSPGGKWIAAGTGNGFWHLWMPDGTEGPTQGGHIDAVSAVAFDPSGTSIATGGWDSTVRLWSADGKPRGFFVGHSGPITSVSWNSNAKRLLTASRDNTLRIWNAQSFKCETVILTMTDGTTATFSATGELLDGKPEALARDLRYIVEQPNGTAELLTHVQFQAIAQSARTP
jgi:WD40 repeat protein